MIPGLNSSFVLFNYSFYTRWFYMPELLCAMATVYVLEHEEFDLGFGAKFSAAAAGLMIVLTLLFPIKSDTTDEAGETVSQTLPRLFTGINPGNEWVYCIM